jgi:hypothetical protein
MRTETILSVVIGDVLASNHRYFRSSPMNEAKTFVAQVKSFFGMLPGQTNMDFIKEIKALTPKDRAELTEMLGKAGYPVASVANTTTE